MGHLFALGVYGLVFIAFEVWRAYRRDAQASFGTRLRAILISCSQFVGPALLFLASRTISDGSIGELDFGTVAERISALRTPFETYGGRADLIVMLFAFAGSIYCVLRRALEVAPAMRAALILVIVAALMMPRSMFSATYADLRLPMVLPFLLIASTELKQPCRDGGLLAILVLAVVGIRCAQLASDWRAANSDYAELRTALRIVEPGAKILVGRVDIDEHHRKGADDRAVAREFYQHIASVAVIDRSAFIPLLFSLPRQQPLRISAGFASINAGIGPPATAPELNASLSATCPGAHLPSYLCNWPQHFDYLLFFDFGYRPAQISAPLQLEWSGSFFTIFRIIPPTAVP